MAVEARPESGFGYAGSWQRLLADEIVEYLRDAQAVDNDALGHAFWDSGWRGRLRYHVFGDECVDLRARVPGLLENLPAMLSVDRRGVLDRTRRPGKLDRQPEGLHFSNGGMLDHSHHLAGGGLWVCMHLLHGEHRP